MEPSIGAAAWALLGIVGVARLLVCELPLVLKFGPRYWRVTRKRRLRDWKRSTG